VLVGPSGDLKRHLIVSRPDGGRTPERSDGRKDKFRVREQPPIGLAAKSCDPFEEPPTKIIVRHVS
jgi:hypothetical protein